MKPFRFETHCLTDKGLHRKLNEDICSVSLEHQYFLVADGIGGLSSGDVASCLFLEAVMETFSSSKKGQQCIARVSTSFSLAHDKIQSYSQTISPQKSMGCTAELLTIHDDSYVLGHVGDSRTYILFEDTLTQITNDHTLVQEQVNQGILSSSQAEKSKMKNVLLQAVGVNEQPEIDIHTGELLPGMIFMLCTDGLYNMVHKDEILPILQYDAPLSLRAEMLVNMANDAGGKDNITVVLLKVLS